MAELRPFRLQVSGVLVRRGRFEPHPIFDAQTVSLESDELRRVIGEYSDGAQAQIQQDLRADTVLAKVGLEPQPLVGFDGVGALILQRICLELVLQADATTFLVEVNHDPLTRL